MELILVDKPKPKPEPKPEPKAVVEPKKVLTTPTPAPTQPVVPTPVENTASAPPSSNQPIENTTSEAGEPWSGEDKPEPVATNSTRTLPKTSDETEEGISCVSNCEPEYPDVLKEAEGSAGVKLTIGSDGNVISAELADANSNSRVNRQALLAARQMQFNSPGEDAASVQVKIDFTVEGSQYDRAAREEQEKREQAQKERAEQEAARQQQLEAERQAQQEQLEREQARQRQLQ